MAGCDRDPLPAQGFSGKVIGVSDGDTITVLQNRTDTRVRLHGVDCPEKGQAFGNRAKEFTADLVLGQSVTIRPRGVDRYGRTVGEVLLPDGRNLSEELVRSGFAWWFRKYAASDKSLARLEADAHTARKGLWADLHPVPPWEWRDQRAIGSNGRTGTSPVTRAVTYLVHLATRALPRCLLVVGLFFLVRKFVRRMGITQRNSTSSDR
jgi:endonuclease YncB( thermonuclease family)